MALVQVTGNNNGAGITNSLTTPFVNPTGANNVILGLQWKTVGGALISSIQDNLGQTYEVIVDTGDGNHYDGGIFASIGRGSGVTSVTVTMSLACVINMTIAEESGLAQTSGPYGPIPVVDGTPNSAILSASGSFNSGTTTTTNPTDILYGFAMADTQITFAATGGWSIAYQSQNITDADSGVMFRQAVSSTGSYATTGTSTPNYTHLGVGVVAFIGNIISPVPPGAKQTFVTETIVQY
jgi:hypothetical protein